MSGQVEIRFRHLSTFPKALRDDSARKYAPFQQGLGDTMKRLRYELERVDAQAAYIQVAVSAGQIMRDSSRPYANATPEHPGVVLVAESKSHGELTWATDICASWTDNLRAIVLTMERLRLADLYDVTEGKQYRGFTALPPAGGTAIVAGPAKTPEWAVEVIRKYAGGFYSAEDIRAGGEVRDRAIRTARRSSHPDQDGSSAAFAEVEQARAILGSGR